MTNDVSEIIITEETHDSHNANEIIVAEGTYDISKMIQTEETHDIHKQYVSEPITKYLYMMIENIS